MEEIGGVGVGCESRWTGKALVTAVGPRLGLKLTLEMVNQGGEPSRRQRIVDDRKLTERDRVRVTSSFFGLDYQIFLSDGRPRAPA